MDKPKKDSIETNKSLKTLLQILENANAVEYIGEPVTQRDHALQAAHFAAKAGATPEEILAALFHDIGHLCADPDAEQMDGLGVLGHEEYGAELLESIGFSEKISELVRGHVQAKRYLVARNPNYAERLSSASEGTLRFQGGPMLEEEAEIFESDPLFRSKLRVRQWDEMAKVPGLRTEPLESYFDLIESQLSQGAPNDSLRRSHRTP